MFMIIDKGCWGCYNLTMDNLHALAELLQKLADAEEQDLNDEHGDYNDHYNEHEDCHKFDRVEYLRDVASYIQQTGKIHPTC